MSAERAAATAPSAALETDAADGDAMEHVREVVARSGTSFLWGMRVLPAPRREAMYAIYAFCREVDDIADEPGTPTAKRAALAAWRREIARLYGEGGAATHPIARALASPVAAFALPRAEFLAVIDGMEMDVDAGDTGGALIAPTFEAYRLYCRRVAGAVGMLSVHAFGDTGPAARELAVVLGEALQTTNILRDLAEDAARGRIYLPGDLLARHGIDGGDPAALLAHPALGAACAELSDFARERFARARGLLARCARRRIRPARLMLEVYERTLRRLIARGWARPAAQVRLGRAERLWIVLRHGLI